MLRWTFDRDAGLAYISLTEQRASGEVTSVPLGAVAEAEGVEALHALVLDFDQDGRLLGIEVAGDAGRILPEDLLAERGHDDRRHRRSVDGF
jgi:uncharacterized protein YuzE